MLFDDGFPAAEERSSREGSSLAEVAVSAPERLSERNPETWCDGFRFAQLSREQMRSLLAVLEASPEYVGEPMTGWLRYHVRKK
jgi:hypothetical protein